MTMTKTKSYLGTPPHQRKHHKVFGEHTLGTSISMVFLFLMAAYFVIPLVWILISSTKSQTQLYSTGMFSFPRPWNLIANLKQLTNAQNHMFWRWFGNSVLYSGTICILSTLFCAMAGYTLSKYKFRAKSAVYWTILFSMMIPASVSVVPLFIMERMTGMLDTYLGVILPQLVNPFGAYFMMTYIGQVMPDELIEAARIDGAGDFRIFRSISLAVIRPGLVTLLLISFIGSWNNFFLPFLLLSNTKLFPLTLGLNNWLGQMSQHTAGSIDWSSVVITGSVLSIVPMLVLFPFLRRYIAEGLAQGAVKI